MKALEEDYAPYKIRKRKPRGTPRIDFSDPAVQGWFFQLMDANPVLAYDYNLTGALYNCLEKNLDKEVNIFGIMVKAQYLFDLVLGIPPNEPRTKPGKNYKKEEWDLWFAHYCKLQQRGRFITEKIIAAKTEHSEETVHSQFKACKRRIDKQAGKYSEYYNSIEVTKMSIELRNELIEKGLLPREDK